MKGHTNQSPRHGRATMSEPKTWTRPARAFSPVETLTEELYARFAETIGMDQDALTSELEGELTPTTLRRVAALTGLSSEFWVGLNRAWNEQKKDE